MRTTLQQKTNHNKFIPKCLIKHEKIVQKHWIRAVLLSVWLPHMRKSPLSCKQRSTRFVFTVYVRIVGTGRQALLLNLIDAHPSPCTHASIRTYTVCYKHWVLCTGWPTLQHYWNLWTGYIHSHLCIHSCIHSCVHVHCS